MLSITMITDSSLVPNFNNYVASCRDAALAPFMLRNKLGFAVALTRSEYNSPLIISFNGY